MKKVIATLIMSAIFLSPTSVNAAKLEPCMEEQCVKYFKNFQRAAKYGHAKANVILGNFYYYGYGVEANPRNALTYFKKAARKKNTAAQYMAGLLYVSDFDFRDIEDGVEYLEKAAKKDHKSAIFMLGVIHLTDEYGLKDKEKADTFLSLAYEKRHPNMPEIIEHITKSVEINSSNFPKLSAQVASAPMLVNADGRRDWPADEVERIEVRGPSLTSLLNSELLAMRKPVKSLGTRFKGKSCAERIGCQSTSADKLDDFSSLVLIPNGFGIVSR
ncbi:sel1 repeat family protein [Glaciecola sp. MH2013]|uniref:tetratricopeptide repeat protein n=1 Tax=Glaciecola sp. MH2013 TaxID=2785524 RepID=UPI00189F9D85|nr:tetratricopeptide repeat protein [Glaciecola sp. MH2013]MBF7073380.1 sel1 repeat family protein [Glaciecola sp. MH2013]